MVKTVPIRYALHETCARSTLVGAIDNGEIFCPYCGSLYPASEFVWNADGARVAEKETVIENENDSDSGFEYGAD